MEKIQVLGFGHFSKSFLPAFTSTNIILLMPRATGLILRKWSWWYSLFGKSQYRSIEVWMPSNDGIIDSPQTGITEGVRLLTVLCLLQRFNHSLHKKYEHNPNVAMFPQIYSICDTLLMKGEPAGETSKGWARWIEIVVIYIFFLNNDSLTRHRWCHESFVFQDLCDEEWISVHYKTLIHMENSGCHGWRDPPVLGRAMKEINTSNMGEIYPNPSWSSHVWCGNDRQSWKLWSVQSIIHNIQKIHFYIIRTFFLGGKIIFHDPPLVRSQWFLTGWIHEGSLVESKRLVKNPWKSQRIRANMPTLVWFSDEFSTEEFCFFVNLYPLLSASWPKSLRVCNWLGCRSLLLN